MPCYFQGAPATSTSISVGFICFRFYLFGWVGGSTLCLILWSPMLKIRTQNRCNHVGTKHHETSSGSGNPQLVVWMGGFDLDCLLGSKSAGSTPPPFCSVSEPCPFNGNLQKCGSCQKIDQLWICGNPVTLLVSPFALDVPFIVCPSSRKSSSCCLHSFQPHVSLSTSNTVRWACHFFVGGLPSFQPHWSLSSSSTVTRARHLRGPFPFSVLCVVCYFFPGRFSRGPFSRVPWKSASATRHLRRLEGSTARVVYFPLLVKGISHYPSLICPKSFSKWKAGNSPGHPLPFFPKVYERRNP